MHEALWQNHTEVIDADVSAYFDTIPHAALMKCVARRVSDPKMLHLIKLWLKVPVEVSTARGRTHLIGGKKTIRGVPQGGVLSPLLSVLYMHRFIKVFRQYELEKRYGAVLVVYADDFVVLCKRNAPEVLAIIRRWFTTMGLALNEQKTTVKQARREAFQFLGYTFTMLHSPRTGQRYPGATPSRKAIVRLKQNVRQWLTRSNVHPQPEVIAHLNRQLRGWANYFRYGSVRGIRHKLDRFVYQRMRGFLRRRHKVPGRGTTRFSWQYVFKTLGVIELEDLPRAQ